VRVEGALPSLVKRSQMDLMCTPTCWVLIPRMALFLVLKETKRNFSVMNTHLVSIDFKVGS
jgi:endonuclease/exonuclease/phosphatase family metal-dependent hydrolase